MDMDQDENEAAVDRACQRPDQDECKCLLCLKGEVVYQATACCHAILQQLGCVDIHIPDCEIDTLQLHLGVAAGQLFDVHVVGDETRLEHFIAGDAANQLSSVMDGAQSGK
jgi:hypothetical protein